MKTEGKHRSDRASLVWLNRTPWTDIISADPRPYWKMDETSVIRWLTEANVIAMRIVDENVEIVLGDEGSSYNHENKDKGYKMRYDPRVQAFIGQSYSINDNDNIFAGPRIYPSLSDDGSMITLTMKGPYRVGDGAWDYDHEYMTIQLRDVVDSDRSDRLTALSLPDGLENIKAKIELLDYIGYASNALKDSVSKQSCEKRIQDSYNRGVESSVKSISDIVQKMKQWITDHYTGDNKQEILNAFNEADSSPHTIDGITRLINKVISMLKYQTSDSRPSGSGTTSDASQITSLLNDLATRIVNDINKHIDSTDSTQLLSDIYNISLTLATTNDVSSTSNQILEKINEIENKSCVINGTGNDGSGNVDALIQALKSQLTDLATAQAVQLTNQHLDKLESVIINDAFKKSNQLDHISDQLEHCAVNGSGQTCALPKKFCCKVIVNDCNGSGSSEGHDGIPGAASARDKVNHAISGVLTGAALGSIVNSRATIPSQPTTVKIIDSSRDDISIESMPDVSDL